MSSIPVDEHDTLTSNLLAFAEVEPIEIPIPLERHLGEKLHAHARRYTDNRPSTRVKDLIDIVLIRQLKPFELQQLRAEIGRVFKIRDARPPAAIGQPQLEWTQPYRSLATEVGLHPDLEEGHRLAADFLDLVLSDERNFARWDVNTFKWQRV